jgi:predicted restriction endonuclease
MPSGIYKRIEYHKKRLSESHKGLNFWSKGRISPMKGKSHTEEAKIKNSEAHKGKHLSPNTEFKKGQNIGDKNFNWKGGITPINCSIRSSTEMKLWRKAVFERDNYSCIWCGQKGGKLNADHIKPFSLFPELRFAIDNGRTLCKECHSKTDTYMGRIKNYTN